MSNKKETKTIKRDVPELVQEIRDFIQTLKGRSKMDNKEARRMFDLYNQYYTASETNYSCTLCVIRIYERLKTI